MQSTLQRVTFVIRLPWHFPDGGWKMSETKGWLNGFHPLLWVWCFLIDRLIPWRNRMCQGRKLMEQTETCIPQTLCLRLNSPAYCSSAQLQLALRYLLLCIACHLGFGLKGQINIRFVFMMFLKCSITLYAQKRKIRHFSGWEIYRGTARRARLTMTHDNDNSFGAQAPGEIGSTVTIQQYK